MNARRARNGMTLLEVIVALTVAGAALAAGASVLGFLTDQQNRSGAQAVSSAHAVRSALRNWVADAQLSTQGDADFRAAPRGARLEHDDEFTFVTSAPTDVARTGTIVRLYVEHATTDSVRGLIAELRPWRKEGAARRMSLAPAATGLSVRFLPSQFGNRKWETRWATSPVLPAAVELVVRFDTTHASGTNDLAAQSLLAIPMTIALGAHR